MVTIVSERYKSTMVNWCEWRKENWTGRVTVRLTECVPFSYFSPDHFSIQGQIHNCSFSLVKYIIKCKLLFLHYITSFVCIKVNTSYLFRTSRVHVESCLSTCYDIIYEFVDCPIDNIIHKNIVCLSFSFLPLKIYTIDTNTVTNTTTNVPTYE